MGCQGGGRLEVPITSGALVQDTAVRLDMHDELLLVNILSTNMMVSQAVAR